MTQRARWVRNCSTYAAPISCGWRLLWKRMKLRIQSTYDFSVADAVVLGTKLVPYLIKETRSCLHGVFPSLDIGLFLQMEYKKVNGLRDGKRD